MNRIDFPKENALENFGGIMLALGVIAVIASFIISFSEDDFIYLLYGCCILISNIGIFLLFRVISEISRTLKNNNETISKINESIKKQ